MYGLAQRTEQKLPEGTDRPIANWDVPWGIQNDPCVYFYSNTTGFGCDREVREPMRRNEKIIKSSVELSNEGMALAQNWNMVR
jgi:hypothetical protein